MKLYMIRHGQSRANETNTHAGWASVPLTEKGRQQAIAARKNIEGVHFDKLFVSDILRTQQTADCLFPDMPRSFIPMAREVNNTPMQGKTPEEMTALYADLYLMCRAKFDYAELGIECESLSHLFDRAAEFLNWAKSLNNAENIAVVSHAGFITTAAAHILGLSHCPRGLACGNASVSIFEYKHEKWSIKLWNLEPTL